MAGAARSVGTVGQLSAEADGVSTVGSPARTLSIIGCGKVGKTLARLWAGCGIFQLRDVLNRSQSSAQQACNFIGAGHVIATYAELRQADVFLIATGDDQIAPTCAALAASGKLTPGSIVFHCSGALSSSALDTAAEQDAAVASIHPIRSFADPQQVTQDFAGTFCGSEGDAAALAVLIPVFEAIGARCVDIKRENKVVYHAAAVFASNYLVTLVETARQAYVKAGLSPDVALQLIAPLLTQSASDAFRIGPAAALTGPIARGDMATVARQYDALAQWNPEVAALYRQFEILTLKLAQKK